MSNTSVNSKALIRYNAKQGGIELLFPEGRRLDDTEKKTLKDIGFVWHKRLGYYYTRYSAEKKELITASFVGHEAKFPAKGEKETAARAAELAAERAAKAPAKKTTNSEMVAALQEQLAKLTEMNLAQSAQIAELLKAMAPATK